MVSPNRNKIAGFRGGRDPAALQENMELLTGQRGNGLDRAITVRELAQLGLINVTRNSQGSVITKPVLPQAPDDKPISIPDAPVNFSGFGGFGAIMLEWKNPTFNGFAYAEIWRAVPNKDNSAPSIKQAVLIATTPATVFGDVVDPGSTFYYWCRFVNTNNVPGPYQGIDGVKVSTSTNIHDVVDDIGSQMKDSELIKSLSSDISNLSSSVTESQQAIKSINKDGSLAYQALWSVKAQAGDIKAGIGFLAKSDGTSQVAVSASQFFVFDPNVVGGETQPLFAIDKGNVVIPKALIESATIQILTAQTIVADKVKSGISISSPQINGGQITGGWAGFGPGGRYHGWRTYINSSGQVFTDGINAINGSFNGHLYATSGEMQNVLIHENCEIKGRLNGATGHFSGTVYVEHLVGDVLDIVDVEKNKETTIKAVRWPRKIKLIPVSLFVKNSSTDNYSKSVGGSIAIGGQVSSAYAVAKGSYDSDMAILSMRAVYLPANQSIKLRFFDVIQKGGVIDSVASFLISKVG